MATEQIWRAHPHLDRTNAYVIAATEGEEVVPTELGLHLATLEMEHDHKERFAYLRKEMPNAVIENVPVLGDQDLPEPARSMMRMAFTEGRMELVKPFTLVSVVRFQDAADAKLYRKRFG